MLNCNHAHHDLILMMILVAGLPGSGKSYFAQELSVGLGGQYLSSDNIRKLSIGSRYNLEDKLEVYDQMVCMAEKLLIQGHDLILDATFYLKSVRRLFYELAEKHHTLCLIIHVFAEEDLIRKRISEPRADSDADFSIYLKVKREFEPISRPHLVLQSRDSNISEMLEKASLFIKESHDGN
ncbi:AAA family ATPase [Anditalea andensis]|uniref:ATP-binding protein n=1 Tax=Anditalea andensis TaxID=1048983 RepID=A0A074LJ19_9BACT|nr:AAA family ATPase [Anditalea andensis]KEO73807.1 hypothetical protein EL17_09880 [Anditalea andensis]